MKKLIFVVVLFSFLTVGFNFPDEVQNKGDLQKLVGKTIILEWQSLFWGKWKVKKKIGDVEKVDEYKVFIKKSNQPWVKAYAKKNKMKEGSKKAKKSLVTKPRRKIYLIEEGKEPVLFAVSEQLLKVRFFYLEKIKVSGEELQPKENKREFEDDTIKILWSPLPEQFGFDLTNKSSDFMEVIWDQCSFVDQKGQTHKVFHIGVKYINKNESQPPSSVPPETNLSDMVVPSDYAYFESEWKVRNNYYTTISDEEKFQSETIRVILTLKKGEKKVHYIFYFKSEMTPIGEFPPKMRADLDPLYSDEAL